MGEKICCFQKGKNACPEGFRSLPEGSITQIVLHSRGVKILKSRGP
jgi:hypothetical protein